MLAKTKCYVVGPSIPITSKLSIDRSTIFVAWVIQYELFISLFTKVQVLYEEKRGAEKNGESSGKTTTQKERSLLLLGCRYSRMSWSSSWLKLSTSSWLNLKSVISLIISTFHSSVVSRFWYFSYWSTLAQLSLNLAEAKVALKIKELFCFVFFCLQP